MFRKNWLNWAAYAVLILGALCLILTIIGAIGNRTELLYYRTALGLFLSAGNFSLPIAGIALLVLILTVFKKAPRVAKTSAMMGLIFAITIYLPYHVFMNRVQSVPRIHDISTDTENPPAFVRIASLRMAGLNSLDYGGSIIAKQQKAAYPEVQPAYLNFDKTAVFAKALAVAKEMDWEVIDSNQREGRIEATDTTFAFGFKDDVVIRITEAGPQKTRVDIRSVSRVGVSDVGVNAARVLKFLHKLSQLSV